MPQARGLAGLRQRTAVKAAATKRDSVPVVTAPAEIDEAIVNWNESNTLLEKYEGEVENAKGEIQGIAEKIRTDICQGSGELVASVRLVASNGKSVLFQQPAKFTKIQAIQKNRDGSEVDNESKILAACGSPEMFERLFQTKTKYVLDESKLAALGADVADQIATRLLRALGEHAELLVQETVIEPNEEYCRGRIGLGDPQVSRIAEKLEDVDRVFRACAPSFKK